MRSLLVLYETLPNEGQTLPVPSEGPFLCCAYACMRHASGCSYFLIFDFVFVLMCPRWSFCIFSS